MTDNCDAYTFYTIQVKDLKVRARRQHKSKAGDASKFARSRFSTQWGTELQVFMKTGGAKEREARADGERLPAGDPHLCSVCLQLPWEERRNLPKMTEGT